MQTKLQIFRSIVNSLTSYIDPFYIFARMKNILRLLPLAAMLALLLFSCDSDTLVVDKDECLIEASYTTNVRDIIESTCSYNTECHAQGSSYGDFSTFDRMQPILNPQKFNDRVLIARNMPPDYADEVGGPTMLTTDQLEILRCWSEANFPE